VATAQRLPSTPVSLTSSADTSLLAWWTEADARAHNAFIAASLGWMLDSFDVMLYAIVVAALIEDLHLSFATEASSIR